MDNRAKDRGISLFLASAGLAGSLGSLATWIGVGNAGLLLISIVLLAASMAAWYRFRLTAQIDRGVVEQVSIREARKRDISSIVSLDKRVFSPQDVIAPAIFTSWIEKNARVLTCMFLGDRLVGYYAVLPLVPEAMHAFVAGRLREHDIKPRDICGPRRMWRDCETLYFFSIVVHKRHPKLLLALLSHTTETLNRFQERGLKKLYASAATDDGRALLQRLGFEQVQDAEDRADRHDLYCKRIDGPFGEI